MQLTNLRNKIKTFPLSRISKIVQVDIQTDTRRRKWRRIQHTVKRKEVNSKLHEVFLGGKDKDIAVYQNTGTRRHFIKPKKKQALSWVDGKRFFSKGHWVGAIKPTNFFSVQDSTRRKIQDITHKHFTN